MNRLSHIATYDLRVRKSLGDSADILWKYYT